MTITSIVENTSAVGMAVEHGLSLYIQLETGKKVLFDMGQGRLFAENAEKLGLSIAEVDVAVLSHGHYDHGGGLRTFVSLNKRAMVYVHRDAFEAHYSLRDNGLRYIGLEKADEVWNGDVTQRDRQLVLCGDSTRIDGQMRLFAHVQGMCCRPVGNRLLYGPGKTEHDAFTHEQNLIVTEGDNVVLFAGCAHSGIVNILHEAERVAGKAPTHVLAGMHLVKSGLAEEDENAFIGKLVRELKAYPATRFYTMHCTGTEQYDRLKRLMGNQISYLSCGESVVIPQ